MGINFFPFSFEFESYIKEFASSYVEKKMTTPSASAAFYGDTLPECIPIVNRELREYGLPHVGNISIWKKCPGEVQTMHIDDSPSSMPNRAAFNIPLLNTNETRMVWYGGRFEYKRVKKLTNYGIIIPYFEIEWKEDYFEEESLELLHSHFVKTDKPHRVFANPTQTRAVVSLRFQGNPSLEEISHILFKEARHVSKR